MLKPDAPKTVKNRTRPGSGGNIALTLCALGVLGFAVAQLGPAAEIRAAEPAFMAGMGVDAAQAQEQKTDTPSDPMTLVAEADADQWGAAFGTPPAPPPPPPPSDPDIVATPAPPRPAPVEPAPTVQRDRSDDYWLTGHILAGDDSVAIVHDGGEEQVVRLGSVLSGGEVVQDISEEGVVAQHDGQEFLIVLRDIVQPARPLRQVTAPSPAAPPAASRAQPARQSFAQRARAEDEASAQDDEDWGDDDDDWGDDDWDDEEWDDDDPE